VAADRRELYVCWFDFCNFPALGDALTFHRLVSARLPGLLATLPFPCAAVAIHGLVLPLMADAPAAMALERTFLACWLAAALVWMWNQEFRFGSFKSIAILLPHSTSSGGFVAYRCLSQRRR